MTMQPRGPHLPTVVRGLFVLALATFVVVWRLIGDPDWAVVGITMGIVAGALFLLAAGVSALLHRARPENDGDRMLSGR